MHSPQPDTTRPAPPPATRSAPVSSRQAITCVALLWLAGNGLRMTILAVPPLIPRIHDDLGMSETEVGILAGLPVILFAVAAVPGSLFIARLGAFATVIAGLLITAAGSALRGAAPDVGLLYAASVVTGFGVAVMQPAMPPLVRAWLPDRIGFGTAVYTNGLLIGEIIPVALTLPMVLPLVGGSWRLAFVAWAIPCVAVAVVMLVLAPRQSPAPRQTAVAGIAGGAGRAPPRRWWPDWQQRHDVAARPDAGRGQCDLFFHQCLPAGISHPDRPGRPGRAGPGGAQYRPAAGLVPAARLRGPIRAQFPLLYRLRAALLRRRADRRARPAGAGRRRRRAGRLRGGGRA